MMCVIGGAGAAQAQVVAPAPAQHAAAVHRAAAVHHAARVGQGRTASPDRRILLHGVRMIKVRERGFAHKHQLEVGKPAGLVLPLGKHHARGAHPLGGRRAAAPKVNASSCTEPNCNLAYQGGSIQNHPQVFLLFWGPSWQTAGAWSSAATYLINFYGGLGVAPEEWSAITSQYGASSTDFPQFTGSVLNKAHVLWDERTPPTGVTNADLGDEALVGATTLGTDGVAVGSNSQIVVVTQSGTFPECFDGENCLSGDTSYCAWHAAVSGTLQANGVTYKFTNLPFTNMPYLPDAGVSCGANFVNAGSAGTFDGFSMDGGHEYAETITDPVPTTGYRGWYDPNDNVSGGGEVGDKCQWGGKNWGGSDPYGDVKLSTGTFAMQSLWSNLAGSCAMASSEDTVSVTNPGSQNTYTNLKADLAMSGTSSAGNPLQWSATGLPTGLSISASGGVKGTASASGSYPVTVYASDDTGATNSATFTWTVEPDTVTVTNPGTRTTPVNGTVSLGIQATSSGGSAVGDTYTWSATGLPTGLSIVNNGLITGTATTAGIYTPTVYATDSTGATGSVTFTWKVPDTVTVNGPGDQSTPTNGGVSLPMSATSSAGLTLSWSATGLPPGLSISSSTGDITGTATTAGSYSATVTASDSSSATASASFNWKVGSDTVAVTSPGDQTTSLNGSVSLPISATSSAGLTLSWSATGLPTGLSIDASTGEITGDATAAGVYRTTVSVSDTSDASDSASFTWYVPDTVTVTNPGDQTTDVNGSVSLPMAGNSSGANTLTWSATGLPPGLTIDSSSGLISGTATASGPYTTTVTATDSTTASDAVSFSWTVTADSVSVTQPANKTGFAQAHASLQLSGSSAFGLTPLTWTVTGLPAGLTLNSATGLITGAPAKAGTYPVTVTATDTSLTSGAASFTWIVKADAGKSVKETSAGVCLTDTGSLAAAGNPVTVAACKTSGAQDWQLSAGPGELSVFGLCLADPGRGGTGTHLALAACKHSTSQEWTYKSHGEYVLKANGLCLTDPKDSKTSGTKVTITACKNTTSQKWTKP